MPSVTYSTQKIGTQVQTYTGKNKQMKKKNPKNTTHKNKNKLPVTPCFFSSSSNENSQAINVTIVLREWSLEEVSLFSLATTDSKPVSLSVASIPQATLWEEGQGGGVDFSLSSSLFSFSSFLLFFAILSLGASLDWFLYTKIAAEPLIVATSPHPHASTGNSKRHIFIFQAMCASCQQRSVRKLPLVIIIIILNNTLLDSAVWKLYKFHRVPGEEHNIR